MAKYLTDELELQSVANAIRAKGGTSGSLAFPSGFVSAIEGIETGGGDHTAEDGIIERTISGEYENSRVTNIGDYAFYSCTSLTTVSFPICTNIGKHAFDYCYNLTTVSFPSCTSIGSYTFTSCSNLTTISFPMCIDIGSSAFYRCSSLTTVNFPVCTSINHYAFFNCSGLTTVSFPACKNIGYSVFGYCTSLTTVSFPACTTIGYGAFYNCVHLLSTYFMGSSMPTLQNSNAFASTPIAGYTTSTGGVYGSIYVPASLLASYKTAPEWSYFSDRFVGVE